MNVNIFTQANKLYKELNAAIKSGVNVDTYVYNRMKNYLATINKRTINTRGLSPAQKMILGNYAKKFLESKTSTVEGAKESYNNKIKRFEERLRTNANYNPAYYDKYVELFKYYRDSDLLELVGDSDSVLNIDHIVDDVNYAAEHNMLDNIKEYASQRAEFWTGYQPTFSKTNKVSKKRKTKEKNDVITEEEPPVFQEINNIYYKVDKDTGELIRIGDIFDFLS